MTLLPVYMIHWNAPDWAASAARTIMNSGEIHVNLKVIDNPSERSTQLRASLPEGVDVVWRDKNDGYTGGANEALRRWREDPEKPEYCVICSHDLHVVPDALATILRLFEENSSYGVIEPTIWQGGPQGPLPNSDAPLVPVEWATGCCLVLRREAVSGIDFDESFGSYVEDVDFCLRVRDAGWEVGLATRAVAWELGSASPRAEVMVKANTVRLRAKRRGAIGGLAATIALVIDAVRSLTGSLAVWRPTERRCASLRRHQSDVQAIAFVVRPSFWRPLLWRSLGRTLKVIGSPKVVGRTPSEATDA